MAEATNPSLRTSNVGPEPRCYVITSIAVWDPAWHDMSCWSCQGIFMQQSCKSQYVYIYIYVYIYVYIYMHSMCTVQIPPAILRVLIQIGVLTQVQNIKSSGG